MPEIPHDAEFRSFVALSARLGAEPLLVQAAGGNTSQKRDGALWIKASGKMLRDALTADIFVPVDLEGVRSGIAREEADPTAGRVLGDTPLRPSIETTLHALLPHRIVLHMHSVNALAWEVRSDGEARIAERLSGLPWAWVPYHRPGLPLTRAVRAPAAAGAAVLALANHGIVVGAADVAAGEALVRDVERRLAAAPRTAPGPDAAKLDAVARSADFQPVADPIVHALATDPDCFAHALAGVLYPDHVVFLGGEACVVDDAEAVPAAIAAYRARNRATPAALLVRGAGVLVARQAPGAATEMLRCQAEVLLRVPPGVALRVLTTAEVGELLNWDAEKFRQRLAC